VAVPYENAWRSLCVSAEGELRCYGAIWKKNHSDPGQRVYLKSTDCGLSWKTYVESNEAALGQAVHSPYTGSYLSLIAWNASREGALPASQGKPPAVYALRSYKGFDDTAYGWHKATDLPVGGVRLPVPMLTRERWLCTAQITLEGRYHPVVFRSDDDGITWEQSILEPAPRHVVAPPHKGLRWQNDACEPTVVELSDGTLMVLARTSQDFHYIYYSHDGGASWTAPEPSRFHGTLTMPTLCRLSDGRILLCWCNTQPLPELDHARQWPPLREGELTGNDGEDVFTNRDANHAAISSDDGKTWAGFRELGLNGIRNASDFRSKGANDESLDKSVHQFEIMELPYNKAMVLYGQHALSRKIVVFDLDWLLETTRDEDFRTGLDNLSTQVYLKSVSGNFRGFSGHCAWNRTNGAVLAPDPEGNFEEALSICRIEDPRLFSPVQGAVWNFPASARGRVCVRMRVEGEGLRLSLTDRWFNPIDIAIADDAHITFVVRKELLPEGRWADVEIDYDASQAKADVYADKSLLFSLPMRFAAPNGLSYLHMQSAADQEDPKGALVKRLQKE